MDDKYFWRAHYRDGRIVDQRGVDGTINAYDTLDRDGLIAFQLIHKATSDVALNVAITSDEEARQLVWTRRTRTKDFAAFVYVHLVGVRDKFVLLLLPDGSVAARSRFSDDAGSLFAEVQQ